MRGINDSYFLVFVSENIREVLELDDIRENEENTHFNCSTVHEHFMPCHTYIPYSLQQSSFQFAAGNVSIQVQSHHEELSVCLISRPSDFRFITFTFWVMSPLKR